MSPRLCVFEERCMGMKRFVAVAGIVALIAACSSHEGKSPSSSSDWGTGLNTVERKYSKPASDTWDAAMGGVKSFNLTVDRDRHDEFGGELVAHRADGHKVTITVSTIDKTNSKAVVRVEPGNSTLATMIHEKMADKLGMGTAKASFLGGNTENFPYDTELQTAVEAAERACKSLGFVVTGKEVKESWATVDARAGDSNPVRFKIERVNDRVFPIKVTFVAGHGKTDESKAMIAKMH